MGAVVRFPLFMRNAQRRRETPDFQRRHGGETDLIIFQDVLELHAVKGTVNAKRASPEQRVRLFRFFRFVPDLQTSDVACPRFCPVTRAKVQNDRLPAQRNLGVRAVRQIRFYPLLRTVFHDYFLRYILYGSVSGVFALRRVSTYPQANSPQTTTESPLRALCRRFRPRASLYPPDLQNALRRTRRGAVSGVKWWRTSPPCCIRRGPESSY